MKANLYKKRDLLNMLRRFLTKSLQESLILNHTVDFSELSLHSRGRAGLEGQS